MTTVRASAPPTELRRARRNGRGLPAGALLVGALLSTGATAHAQMGPFRLDGLAATVGGRSPGPGVEVILRSDVELRAELELLGRNVKRHPDAALPEPLLAAKLQELIGEHLIEREALRIRATPPRRAEIRAELERLYSASGGQDAVRALLAARGAEPTELQRIARRRAVVGAFLRSNLEGTTVVTEAHIDAALAELREHAAEGERLPSREALRSQLRRRALDDSIAHWVRVLRGRITVRVYASYATR